MTEIINYIKSTKDVVYIDELHRVFPNITENELLNAAAQPSDIIMRHDGGMYLFFHISSVDISNENIEDIKKIIEERITENGFITYRQLAEEIKGSFPVIYDKNLTFNSKDLISTFKYYLEKDFYFNRDIISSYNNRITSKDIYKEYAKGKSKLYWGHISRYERETGIKANYQAILEDFLYVAPQYFIPKEEVYFDIEKIDDAIDRLCTGDYIAADDRINYSDFPDVGFSWNRRLLNCFVYKYSKRYKILVNRYVDERRLYYHSTIVKRSSGIDTLEKLLVTVLAESGENLNYTDPRRDPWRYTGKYASVIQAPLYYIYRILEEAKLIRSGKRTL